jgi:molybdate transport system ATP-binding protein
MIEIDISKKLFSAQGEFTLDLKLNIAQGEFISIFGQSGAGKTTLLRCLAGLEQPDSGFIKVRGVTWFDSKAGIMLKTQHRHAGYMFQDYALFPNMSIRGNLEFALRPGARRERVSELIELMGLGDLQQRKPDTLSGGQKQRVALARALAAEPDMLLLDEPFSALDHATRVRLQDEVMRMQRHFGLTTVMVSHDISEVYKLSQRVMVIEQGRIANQGTPAEVFKAGQSSIKSGSSGKFSFAGEVLDIETADVVFAVTLLVGNQIVRVIATPDEVKNLQQGDRVMLMSKAFNPVLVAVAT